MPTAAMEMMMLIAASLVPIVNLSRGDRLSVVIDELPSCGDPFMEQKDTAIPFEKAFCSFVGIPRAIAPATSGTLQAYPRSRLRAYLQSVSVAR
jgi:hypothetical protein